MAYISQNPWTAEISHCLPFSDNAALTQQLQLSQKNFPRWQQFSFAERGEVLTQLSVLLLKHKDTLKKLMHNEMGKLLAEAEAEIVKSAQACAYYAKASEQLLATEKLSSDYTRSELRYEPIGTVLGVMPWNFPLWQIIRFIAPTMMAGNCVLLKPAENTAQTALYLAQLLDQAGCPSGVYQNLLMDNQQCAEVIANPIVKAVSLTGSELAGRSIARTAGQSLKKCVLELGGSDAFIVLKDADIQQAAKTAALSRFSNAGQTCIAAKRFIVLEEVVDAFIAALKQEAQSFSCDSNDPEKSGMAVMAKASLKEKLQQQVNDSIHQGAEIIYRAEASEHPHSFPATILDHVASGMPAYDEELFGPVASIIRVKSIEQAITVANDTSFGLAASIWSQNTEQASILANQLDCGSVFINSLVKSDIRLPFGGCKQSGFGRELSALGIREFCNIKTVVFA